MLQGTWRDSRLDSASFLVKISAEDRAQNLLDRFSVEATVQDPFARLSVQGVARLSVQGVYKRFPQKISVRDLWARSLFSSPSLRTGSLTELSWQDLCTRSRQEVSWQDLLKRSLCKLSKRALGQDLCKRPFGKVPATDLYCNVSVQDFYERSLGKISVKDLYKRSLGKISLWDLLRSSP